MGANDQEYFSSENISVNDGLTLSAVPDQSQPGFSYRSAAVSTYGKDPVSGTVLWEIDAKMPDSSSGMWPGIWFLPDSPAVYPPGQNSDEGEIDLFEGGYTQGSADPNTVLAMHYAGASSLEWQAPSSYPIVPDLSGGFHVYGLKYVPGVSITYYLDGQEMWQVTNNVASFPYELLLDLQVASAETVGWHTQTGPNTPAVSDFDIAQVAEYAASGAKATTTTPYSPVAPAAQLPEASSMVLFPALGVLGFVAFGLSGRRRRKHAPRLVR
jgi:beta-glucanase (GH16 family)